MLVNANCIVLRVIKFNDNRTIVAALLRELGRVSFIVPEGKSAAAAKKRAMLMPGSRFEAIVDIRETRQLQTLRDITPVGALLPDNPVKTTILLFLCDFLNTILRDNQPDHNLFDYIDDAFNRIINEQTATANSVICFLIGLQRFMGIEPDRTTYRPGALFDMTNGVFRLNPTVNARFLDPFQSQRAATLLRMNHRNAHHFRLTRAERSEALDLLLEYYSIHFGSLKSLNSLPVLRAIFS